MPFEAVVSAGPGLEPDEVAPRSITVTMPNPRCGPTEVTSAMTGGHLLHLAIAACVLNDIYREAQKLGIAIDRVEVSADGGFAGEPVISTGIEYSVEIDSPASPDDIDRLLALVDEIAEIPSTLRAGAEVTRV